MKDKERINDGDGTQKNGSRRRFLKRVGGAGVAASLGVSVPETTSATDGTESRSPAQGRAPERAAGKAAAVRPMDVPRADESERDTDVDVPVMLTMSVEEYRNVQNRVKRGDFPQPPASAVQRVPRDEGGDDE